MGSNVDVYYVECYEVGLKIWFGVWLKIIGCCDMKFKFCDKGI